MNSHPHIPNGRDPRKRPQARPAPQTPPPGHGRSYAPPTSERMQTNAGQVPPPQRQFPQEKGQRQLPQGQPRPQNRHPLTPQELARRRAAIARREAQRRARRNRLIAAVLMGIALLILIVICIRACTRDNDIPTGNTDPDTEDTSAPITTPEETTPESPPDESDILPLVLRPQTVTETHTLTNEIDSTYAVLVSLADNTILAQKAANAQMHPASMTKVMSLIVAYEHIEDLSETFTVTSTIIDPVYTAGASLAGFSPNETVTIADLLYGMILPSGAEASVALAEYVAGSEDAFVDLMNEKAASMGLNSTHFENCTGLSGTNHYSTAVEMAMILAYAMQYEDCAKILSTYQYTTTATEKHPDGVLLESTMFSRMYGDEPEGVTIIAGKTGYTDRAHHCLMSYARDDETGDAYIFVSADSTEKFGPVFDAIEAYSSFTKKEEDTTLYLP